MTTKSTTKKAPAKQSAQARNAGSRTFGKGQAPAKKSHAEAQAKVAENAAKVAAMNEEAEVASNKVDRIALATAESKAAKAAGWRFNKEAQAWEPQPGGTQQPKPPTVNLDFINAEAEQKRLAAPADDSKEQPVKTTTAAKKAPAKKASAAAKTTTAKAEPKASKSKQPLFFLINGQPVIDAHNSLAGVARATGRNGGKRLPTPELRALLQKNGIAEPDSSVWKFELPNGVVLSTGRTKPAAKKDGKAA